MTTSPTVRPCSVCGLFYPENPDDLGRMVADLIARAGAPGKSGRVLGLVSPHAGYIYSGYTASHGFAALRGQHVRTVVIVSPSHREYFEGVAVFPGDAYATPFGQVRVDAVMRERLLDVSSIMSLSDAGHGEEHAIEVQIPFLQHVISDFMILPIVMGDQRREYCVETGRALAAVIDPTKDVLLASTDLSHYHSQGEAVGLDRVFVDDVAQCDPEKLMADLEAGSTEACGGGPSVAVMTALRSLGAVRMEVLHYCNSGDVTGDDQRVVGYLSAVAYA